MTKTGPDSKRELVSIGLPTYAGGLPYLKRAIDSVLGQTYRNIELIITENPSRDGGYVARGLCEELVRRDKRVKYIRHPTDIGTNANYISALDNARGEYFCWVGFDDFLHPRFVVACITTLKRDTDAVVAMSDYKFANAKGELTHRIDPREYVITERDLYARLKRYILMTWSSGKVMYIHGLWRRAVIAEDVLEELPDGDINFVFRRLARGPFVFVPEILFYKGLLPGGESREHEKITVRRTIETVVTRIKLIPAQFWNTGFILHLKTLPLFSRIKLVGWCCVVAMRLFTMRRY